jgi:hypothetical protein
VAHTIWVQAKDLYGNTVTGYTGSIAFTSSDPLAMLPGPYTFTAADAGTHAFSVTLKTAGTQSITVKDTLSTLVTGQQFITVKPATATTVRIAGTLSATVGTPQTYTVTAYDPFGNVATGYTGTVHFNSSDPTAGLPPDYTFTTADAGTHAFPKGVTFHQASGNATLGAIDTLFASIQGSLTGIVVT